MAKRESNYQTYGVSAALFKYCQALEEMMKDEHKAPGDYARLIALARNVPIAKADVATISKIPPDEKKHYRWLDAIYDARCKRPFSSRR